MKRKAIKELHQKNKEELKTMLDKAVLESVHLKMEKQSGKLKNVCSLGEKRKEVARIKTILKEKESNL